MNSNTFDIDSICNEMFWDQLTDVDQLFAATANWLSDDIDDQHGILINDEYQEIPSLPIIDDDQSLSNNSPPKQTDPPRLICGVCGAPAYGHNFDQITCESCKAFFRRNALRYRPNLKCRFDGSCVINIQTRRHCPYCRLKKCFDINMRKDWIRTEEEVRLRQLQKLVKEQKKSTNNEESLLNLPLVARTKKRIKNKSINEDVTVKPIPRQIFNVNNDLFDEDRIRLNNVGNAYQFIAEQALAVRQTQHDFPPTLIKFINAETKIHESLINYFKLLPEFKELSMNNQILLIKSNLVKIIHFHCVLVDQFRDNNRIGAYMERWVSPEFHQGMARARQYSYRFIEHPLIIKLVLIVLIFTIDLSVPYYRDTNDDYSNKDRIRVSQDFYITLLWRYLISVYNEKEAIRSMNTIVAQVLRYQTLMNTMEAAIRQQSNNEAVNQLEVSLFRLTV